jgi:hypothetical protein
MSHQVNDVLGGGGRRDGIDAKVPATLAVVELEQASPPT